MGERILDLLTAARARLRAAPHTPPAREANLLLGHVLGWPEVRILAHDDEAVGAEQAAAFMALVERRLQGEPVAYLTGEREFFGRSFAVDSRVLIPRPETEHLIEAAMAQTLPPRACILDVGTGSGCIAVTLALALTGTRVVATDASLGALAVAWHNVRRFGVDDRVLLTRTDWLSGARTRSIDLVVANPPYIAQADAATLSPEITDFEPHEALFSGTDGLTSYRQLFAALASLRSGTPVLCEVGHTQASAVADLAHERGFVHHRTIDDYAGFSRVVVVIRG